MIPWSQWYYVKKKYHISPDNHEVYHGYSDIRLSPVLTGKPLTLKNTVPAAILPFPISLTEENGMIPSWRISSEALLCSSFINAVVPVSYPKDAFHTPKVLWAFNSTNVSLNTCDILDKYAVHLYIYNSIQIFI